MGILYTGTLYLHVNTSYGCSVFVETIWILNASTLHECLDVNTLYGCSIFGSESFIWIFDVSSQYESCPVLGCKKLFGF